MNVNDINRDNLYQLKHGHYAMFDKNNTLIEVVRLENPKHDLRLTWFNDKLGVKTMDQFVSKNKNNKIIHVEDITTVYYNIDGNIEGNRGKNTKEHTGAKNQRRLKKKN